MAFNARWALEELAKELNRPLINFLVDLQSDFEAMVRCCPTYRLQVQSGGNCFRISDRRGADYTPRSLPGLYTIFTPESFVYFGEATDLCRRQLKDPDNTADSGKVFTNQGRAILKLLLHHSWTERLSLSPLFIQTYPADCHLDTREGRTFEECYRVARFTKALEGALSLFVPRYHGAMLTRAALDGLVPEANALANRRAEGF
jgi:hypothetical protein